MINIVGDYYLDSDPSNFILYKWNGTMTKSYKNREATPKYQQTRYYEDLETLFQGLFKCLLRDKIAISKTMEDVYNALRECREILADIDFRLNDVDTVLKMTKA